MKIFYQMILISFLTVGTDQRLSAQSLGPTTIATSNNVHATALSFPKSPLNPANIKVFKVYTAFALKRQRKAFYVHYALPGKGYFDKKSVKMIPNLYKY